MRAFTSRKLSRKVREIYNWKDIDAFVPLSTVAIPQVLVHIHNLAVLSLIYLPPRYHWSVIQGLHHKSVPRYKGKREGQKPA